MERVGRTSSRRCGGGAAIRIAAIFLAHLAQDVRAADGPSTRPAAGATSAPATRPVKTASSPADTVKGEGAPPAPKDNSGGPLHVTSPGVFSANFLDLDVRLALRLLGSRSHKNIIATKEVKGTVTADLYQVTFQEALNAILRSSGLVHQEKGNFIYVMTAKEFGEAEAAGRRMKTQVFRLFYIRAADAKALIERTLSAEGKMGLTPASITGITASSTEAGGDGYAANDVVVVTDYEENLREVASILSKLDIRPQQVLIEATLLRATLNENNALGVDFNTLAGIDFQSMSSSSPGIQSLSTGSISGATLPNSTPAATFRTDFNSAIPGGGLTIGFISNEASFFIRALEAVTDVTVMANPKLLVVNKQRGQVMIGNRDGYLTTTVTETVATQTVQFLETGTQLIVRPFIGKNGYVRLEIHPKDSSGSVEPKGNSVLPSETTTEVTSNVFVRDGRTIVIGGLFRERTSSSRSQIPLLGNLPYVGAAFRRTIDDTVREEVIILITVRVIHQDAAEAASEQIKNDLERFRIGQRKGLRWWGRERLSHVHMQRARAALRRGWRGWALWHVDMALSLSPRMLDAIRLKERITEKAYWSDVSQVSATRYVIQRMIMTELGLPAERVSVPRRPLDTRKLDPSVRKMFGIRPRVMDPLPDEDAPATSPGPRREGSADSSGGKVKTPPESVDNTGGGADANSTGGEQK